MICANRGLDRALLNVSSKLAEPICWGYGLVRYRLVTPLDPKKFDNCSTKTREIALRVVIAVVAIAATITLIVPLIFLALGIASKITRAIGFALQKNGYTHVKGQAPEKILNGQTKIMTWNVCGIGGGMHYDHGGVISWRSRLDRIVATILKENPDVLLLQEIYDTSLAEALIKKLSPHYPHFFTHIGPNTHGSISGEMVISKCPYSRFTSTSFTNNDWTLNRTFTILDIKAAPEATAPVARIIGTHLIHDDNAKRIVQVAQIVNAIAKETLPTVIGGDLNLERNVPSEGGLLAPHFEHGYQGALPTCTNKLVQQWEGKAGEAKDETIDYISLYKNRVNAQLHNTRLIPAYTPDYDTRTALSDHNPLVSTLRWT